MLPSGSEINEKFWKKNKSVRKNKSNPNEKKVLKLKELEEITKLAFGTLFKTNSTGNPYVNGIALLQTLSENIFGTSVETSVL